MHDESQFQSLVDGYITSLADRLETADTGHLLEIDMDSGVLTIELVNGQQFVVNRHLPTRQLWLSSPVSGGLHFSYVDAAASWMLPDGREFETLLLHELKKLTNHSFTL